MVTKTQAIAAGEKRTEFHYGTLCERPEVWRSNGKCKTWKTRPGAFRLPIKWGFRGPFGYITELNAEGFHFADVCLIMEPKRKGLLTEQS